MSSDGPPLPDGTITLAAYRKLKLARPLTDEPIGGTTNSRRDQDARHSAIHTNHDELPTLAEFRKTRREGRIVSEIEDITEQDRIRNIRKRARAQLARRLADNRGGVA